MRIARGPPRAATANSYETPISQWSREMSTTPPIATPTTSHHPAFTGLPPSRTRRVSTGWTSGAVTARSMRPTAPKGETRPVRTSHEPVAASAAEGGEAPAGPGGAEPAAAGRHRRARRPAVARWVVGFDDGEVAVGVEGPAADREHQARDRDGGEVIARGGDRRAAAPAVRGGIVDRGRVHESPPAAPPAHDDQPSVRGRHPRGAARGGARRAGPPHAAILALQPPVVLGPERPTREPAHRVQRVAHDGQRHVVARRGEVGDARPAIRGRIVAPRGRRDTAPLDAARDVDPAVQHGGRELLRGHRQRRGDGPAAVARRDTNASDEGEGMTCHEARGTGGCGWVSARPPTSRRGAAAPRGPRTLPPPPPPAPARPP